MERVGQGSSRQGMPPVPGFRGDGPSRGHPGARGYSGCMPQWLLFVISLLALAAGVSALLRANRVDAAVRRALAALPVDAGAPAPEPKVAPATVTLPDVQGPLCRVGLVRFDAFADVSGKLSSSAALLDEHGNGLVLTTMNGRDNTRNYLKQVRRGVGVAALSPEESDAVARAMANTERVS